MNDKLIWKSITEKIKIWGHEFGFDEIGISDIKLNHTKKSYDDWIKSRRNALSKKTSRYKI